jgi:primosomal protein N' (replication factor Y)
MGLPDYSAEERSFQLLYQIMGRVGRGHGKGRVIVQTYEPDSPVLRAAIARDWLAYYEQALPERQAFRFPPFAYLLKLVCRRATSAGAQKAAIDLKSKLLAKSLPVEVIGPTPSFYGRRGRYYYWQIVVKSKSRDHLLSLARDLPSDWTIDLDPVNLI